MNRKIIFILLVIFSNQIISQKKQIDSLSKKELIAINPLTPSKAAFYSAVIPGLGQIYTKKFWKLPLVYGMIGSSIYGYHYNNKEMKRYRVAYKRRLAGYIDDEFYGSDDEFPIEKSEPAPEIPEGRPLDEFEDKTINAEPEIIERPGDSLISELSGQDSNESIPEPEEPEAEESVEEDDGISVDEYGTEWWEDENGTWWYREEGAEDWPEFTE
mgnify:CR=1 FL=1